MNRNTIMLWSLAAIVAIVLLAIFAGQSGDGFFYWFFAATTCFGAIAVVVTQNVVRMAFWLVVSLGSAAGLFFLLNADFVAVTQLMIYVGGTLVLLIFGVMLTASGPYTKVKSSPAEGFMSAGIGVLLLMMFVSTVLSVNWETSTATSGGYNAVGEGNTIRPLGLSFLGLRPDKDLGTDSGQLSPGYLLPFEIVSIHLLVVLIGAAYLARAKRRIDVSSE